MSCKHPERVGYPLSSVCDRTFISSQSLNFFHLRYVMNSSTPEVNKVEDQMLLQAAYGPSIWEIVASGIITSTDLEWRCDLLP